MNLFERRVGNRRVSTAHPHAVSQSKQQTRGNQRTKAELLAGLQQAQKQIHCKYLYDKNGSALFERITQLPEYYLSRTEVSLLLKYGDCIRDYVGRGGVLIEPGSGNCRKVRLLLPNLRPEYYIPLDISIEYLHSATQELKQLFPWLTVCPVSTDYTQAFNLPDHLPRERRVFFYPGSTIGNFSPDEAILFLKRMHRLLDHDGGLLIGVDLEKNPRTLQAAYNDTEGVTAAFNLNILNHVNRLLDAEFNRFNFSHYAYYNDVDYRIEMHLVANISHRVYCDGRRQWIDFIAGESIVTEYAYKFTPERFIALAEATGFVSACLWIDEQQLFSVHYLKAA